MALRLDPQRYEQSAPEATNRSVPIPNDSLPCLSSWAHQRPTRRCQLSGGNSAEIAGRRALVLLRGRSQHGKSSAPQRARSACAFGIPSVLGNHDYRVNAGQARQYVPKTWQYLEAMSFCLEVELGPVKMRLYHASPRSRDDAVFARDHVSEEDLLRVFGDRDADVFVVDHTRVPRARQIHGVWYVNPGALSSTDGPPSLCLHRESHPQIIQLASPPST